MDYCSGNRNRCMEVSERDAKIDIFSCSSGNYCMAALPVCGRSYQRIVIAVHRFENGH